MLFYYLTYLLEKKIITTNKMNVQNQIDIKFIIIVIAQIYMTKFFGTYIVKIPTYFAKEINKNNISLIAFLY